MDDSREAVLEDILTRLAEERGIEVLALDWKILEDIAASEKTNEESSE